MASFLELDNLFLDIAQRVAQMSKSRRTKVGAVVSSNGNVVSMGWNGTPAGFDNNCEIEAENGELVTRPEVMHAESNALLKLVKSGGVGAAQATMYTTLSPCLECSKLIAQAGINRVVFREQYRNTDGIEMLKKLGVTVEQQ